MMAGLSEAEISFVRMLEMSLLDLFACDEICLNNDLYQMYFKALVHYLSGSKIELRSFLDEIKQVNGNLEKFEYQVAIEIAELRYLILEKDVLQSISINDLKAKYESKIENLENHLPQLWVGEWYFVWARIYDMKKDHKEASLHYFKAKDAYEKIGASKKAVKAYFNGIICQERGRDFKHLHYQYIKLIFEARKVKEYCVVGMALLALSQKLMDIGSLRLSLEYAQRSLAFLSKEKGSSNYFKALLHRSYLYYLLGQIDKAKIDYQEAKLSTHTEVLGAVSILESKTGQSGLDSFNTSLLPYAWISRLHYEKDNLQLLGLQEELLIQILLKKPTSKAVILEKIWGSSIDMEHIDLRFKKLMWRIKQKHPNIIEFSNGLYALNSLRVVS